MNDVAAIAQDVSATDAGWRARLSLGYEVDGARTVLTHRVHEGPLVVQKSLYPEGDAVCQNIIVHPPGGIVGGDRLALNVIAGVRTNVQLTTPGAAKWYRSAGAPARQVVRLRAAAGAALEWLPQETIVFNGAMSELETKIELTGDASFLGWDIVCLGRSESGERFVQGRFRQRVELLRDGERLWIERAAFDGDAPLLRSPVGLNNAPVFGTFLAAATKTPSELLAACRLVPVPGGEGAVTRLPGLIVARHVGQFAEETRDYFTALWRVMRPALLGRDATRPRIWNT